MGDIKGMFHQVCISPKYCDDFCFLNLVPRVSSCRPLERARRDPAWGWSHATLTIKNSGEGSSVISNLLRCIELCQCQIQSIALWLPLPAALKFRIISILTVTYRLSESVSMQFKVVVMFSVAVLPTGFRESQSFQLWMSSTPISCNFIP